MSRKFHALALLAVIAAVAVAGCGGSDNGDSTSAGGYGGTGETGTTSSGGGGGGAYAAPAGGGSGGAYAAPAAAPNAEEGTTFVSLGNVPELGPVLVDSKGFTLYDFHKDKGGKSACYGACAKIWPPLLTEGEPQVGEGAMAAKLGTTKRKDGTMQVTYAGWPLYTYAADEKPGDANGNDIDSFGAEWYALVPSGEEAEG